LDKEKEEVDVAFVNLALDRSDVNGRMGVEA
jgi:hypothetical protein